MKTREEEKKLMKVHLKEWEMRIESDYYTEGTIVVLQTASKKIKIK